MITPCSPTVPAYAELISTAAWRKTMYKIPLAACCVTNRSSGEYMGLRFGKVGTSIMLAHMHEDQGEFARFAGYRPKYTSRVSGTFRRGTNFTYILE